MLESNLRLESPRRPLMWYTFELGLKPSLVLQWSLCHYIHDIYMWKNTQLGPLFICFKREEPHKSSGRAEHSQKAVDVRIASTVSRVGFHPHGWQQRSLSVWHRVSCWYWRPLPPVLANGMLQDQLKTAYQKNIAFSCLPNTPVLFKELLSSFTACMNIFQCWEGFPTI